MENILPRREARENAFLLAFSQTFGDIPLAEALSNHAENDEEHPVDAFSRLLLNAYYDHSAEVDDEIRALIENDRKQLFGSFCRACGYCMPCPKGINIPGCFAAYNASYAHSWFTGLSQYFTASAVRTSEPKLVSNCVKCGKCARHCPQHIDIPERLDDVRRRFQPGLVTAVLKAFGKTRS